MAYDLDQFVSECRAILKRDGGPQGREQVRLKLEQLLSNRDFVERSEERRVGKECRSRWSPCDARKNGTERGGAVPYASAWLRSDLDSGGRSAMRAGQGEAR